MNANPEPEARHEWTPDQVWAAMMLAADVETCTSLLSRKPVRAGNLNVLFLRRALRRLGVPDPHEHMIVTPDMLAAIVEAGPIDREGLVEVDGGLW